MDRRMIRQMLGEVIDEMLDKGIYWPEFSSQLEKLYIMSALSKTNGSVYKAAELMGIHRNTLSKRIQEYGIDKSKLRKKNKA
ncbi:MAG TPA: helix-turn-helix domain-containing protein [Acidobacteriota bacterium]|nr:helix-turn-helix domain-containing protein [Acidobacteriota bacterium]